MSLSALITKMHAESLRPVQLLRSITNIPPKPTRDSINISQSISSPLTTYNVWNNPAYRAHTPLKHHILYLNHANIRCKFYHSMPLHTNTANFAPSSNLQEILLAYKLNSNDPPFAHLFVLIIIYLSPSRIYTPLKRPILYLKHSNTQRKVYHTMPLHTYTANFTTSSTLQEILSNRPLIIYGIIMYIGHKHHSHILFYFMPNTQRKVYHSSPLHTYKVQIHIHYRYI